MRDAPEEREAVGFLAREPIRQVVERGGHLAELARAGWNRAHALVSAREARDRLRRREERALHEVVGPDHREREAEKQKGSRRDSQQDRGCVPLLGGPRGTAHRRIVRCDQLLQIREDRLERGRGPLDDAPERETLRFEPLSRRQVPLPLQHQAIELGHPFRRSEAPRLVQRAVESRLRLHATLGRSRRALGHGPIARPRVGQERDLRPQRGPEPSVLDSHTTHFVAQDRRHEDERRRGDQRYRHENAAEREHRAPKRRRRFPRGRAPCIARARAVRLPRFAV